jgi:hypothetical protein
MTGAVAAATVAATPHPGVAHAEEHVTARLVAEELRVDDNGAWILWKKIPLFDLDKNGVALFIDLNTPSTGPEAPAKHIGSWAYSWPKVKDGDTREIGQVLIDWTKLNVDFAPLPVQPR